MTVPAGYRPVWIQGASVLINETTGAILVDSSGDSAGNSAGDVLLACGKITVAADATLNTLLGTAVNTLIRKLLLVPRTSDAVFAALGAAATSASALLPSGGLGIGCDCTIGTTLHLYAASSVVVDVYQLGKG